MMIMIMRINNSTDKYYDSCNNGINRNDSNTNADNHNNVIITILMRVVMIMNDYYE